MNQLELLLILILAGIALASAATGVAGSFHQFAKTRPALHNALQNIKSAECIEEPLSGRWRLELCENGRNQNARLILAAP